MRVTTIVDNLSPAHSRDNRLVTPWKGEGHLLAESGLSFLIETDDGSMVLMDTGRSETALAHNLEQVGLAPSDIDLVFISHDHYDHTGGLALLAEEGVPVIAHPEVFKSRRFLRGEGGLKMVSSSQRILDRLRETSVSRSDKCHEIRPGLWSSGQIERTNTFETTEGFLREEGGELVGDDVDDEMALFLEARDGTVVLCGCCHAGVVNIAHQAIRIMGRPVELIMGGFHLREVAAARLDRTIDHLCTMDVRHVAPMHCTGFDAMRRISEEHTGFELASVGSTVVL